MMIQKNMSLNLVKACWFLYTTPQQGEFIFEVVYLWDISTFFALLAESFNDIKYWTSIIMSNVRHISLSNENIA